MEPCTTITPRNGRIELFYSFSAFFLYPLLFLLALIAANFIVASLIWVIISFDKDKWQNFVEKLVEQPAK